MTRPRVRPGDGLVLPASVDNGEPRRGVVVEVLGPDGSPPCIVRWADGSQTIIYLSSAAQSFVDGEVEDLDPT